MTDNHSPTVSVIVPCYNAAGYLGETLGAILDQSWTDLEVIVVDDGSTDDPGAVVAAFGEPRIRFQSTPPSGGPSHPRNVGISVARGQYVFFCDADDVMLPGKIEGQVRVLADNPEVGLVFTNFQVIDPHGEILVTSFLADYSVLWRIVGAGSASGAALDGEQVVRGLLRANFIGTSSVAVRRLVLADVGGFDESLASSEDLDLWLRIARRHDCGFLDIIGHGYRRHPGSLMQEGSARHPLARIEVLRRQLAGEARPQERRIIRRRIAMNHASVGYAHERSGNHEGARRHYLESLRLSPSLGACWGWLKTQTLGRLP
jgi:glycosyltransferase involved in cell wall biosynthesis